MHDKLYNSKSDFKIDEIEEEENKVIKDEQSLEEVVEEKVSIQIKDFRETKLDTTFALMKPIVYDWFDEQGRQKVTVYFFCRVFCRATSGPRLIAMAYT